MDLRDDFDRALERAQSGRRPPDGAIDSAVETHEALLLAWASTRVVFGDAATPALAVSVARLILSGYRAAARQSQDTDWVE